MYPNPSSYTVPPMFPVPKRVTPVKVPISNVVNDFTGNIVVNNYNAEKVQNPYIKQEKKKPF